jgi:hypothetical protein
MRLRKRCDDDAQIDHARCDDDRTQRRVSVIRFTKIEVENGEVVVVRLLKQWCEDPEIVSIDSVVVKD